MLATQTELSDGTLNIVNVGIEFFEQDDISVALDHGDPLVEGVDYQWTAATTIQFLATVNTPGGLVPNGVEVLLRRDTKNDGMLNVYDGGAPFSRLTLDENFEQLLRLSQEFSEGLGLDSLQDNLDMHGFRVVNVGDPVDDGDAVNKQYLAAQNAFNLRVSDLELVALPIAAIRANKVLTFGIDGQPIVTTPASGSATDVLIQLADGVTPGNGVDLVAHATDERDLADAAAVALGAAMVARNSQVVPSIAALKLLLKTSPSKFAFATGFYGQGDGGGGEYWLDVADESSVEIPGILVVAADGGRWKLVRRGAVSVRQMGVIADVFDAPTRAINDAALLAARNWAASGSVRNHLLFTAGVYAYNTSPNWAIQNLVVTTEGEVRLRYFGTGNAVIIDHGPTPGTYLFNVKMGSFLVEAPATAMNGVYVRSVHHGGLQFKVRGAGTNYAGIQIEFAVCTDFSGCSCYPNDDGNWYLGAKPKYGLSLATRGVGESVSYCMFTNTIWEGLDQAGGAGMLLDGTLGNVFQGGTSERCNHGIITTANAINNRFYGIDWEANIARDVLEGGQGNEYHGIDSELLITVANTALFPKFFGGNAETIEIAAGARWPLFSGVSVNRFGTVGGGFINGEPTSMFRACIDLQTQQITPLIQGAIAVGASQFTYTNSTGNDQLVAVGGGTGVSLIYTRAGVDVALSQQIGTFHLSPGDALKVTYSVVPNMYFWQK